MWYLSRHFISATYPTGCFSSSLYFSFLLSLWRELLAKIRSAGRDWTPRRKSLGRRACPSFDRLPARTSLPQQLALPGPVLGAPKEPATLVPAREASQVCIYCTLAFLGSRAEINHALGLYVLTAFLPVTLPAPQDIASLAYTF